MTKSEISQAWSEALVVEPTDHSTGLDTVGAFILTTGSYLIISQDPGTDFELNTDVIQQWKIIFQAGDRAVLGEADYATVLQEIPPYIIDQQNGSLLIRILNDDDLHELLAKTIFN